MPPTKKSHQEKTQKIAVLLFSLGAPEKISSVQPFLTNLFNDPAITGLPTPIRQILAFIIAKRRTPQASIIYQHMGGGSPLLPNTQKQADALLQLLKKQHTNHNIRCIPVMRYWHPRAKKIAQELKNWQPNTIVFLPMYPQFSTTTNRSSMLEMHQELNKHNISASRKLICCFPDDNGFIKAATQSILPLIKQAKKQGFENPQLLLSAHGVPKSIITKRGDPYLDHCQKSAQKIIEALGNNITDSRLCFQSKVGPLEWLQPYTEDAIKQAGEAKKALIIFPLAFVSEHSETLVELDIEYKHLADESGVPLYLRAPAVAENSHFINGLAQLVNTALKDHTPQQDGIARPTCTLKEQNSECPKNISQCCPLDVLSLQSLQLQPRKN